MTNDPVLALIEKWEADARRQDWPANGEFLTPQECAKQIRAILPQRDRERDAQVQIGTAKHITGGVDDGCMCGPCIILRKYLDGERAATLLAALEEAAEFVKANTPYQQGIGSVGIPMSKHILSLASQSDLDWLKRHDTEVAIKEAEWWADFDPLDVDTQDQWDLIAAE